MLFNKEIRRIKIENLFIKYKNLYSFIYSILINIINISIYLLTIYILSNPKILSYIPEEYSNIHKLLQFYKNIRVLYIIYEVILLLISLIILISLSYGIVSFYIHIK